MSIESDLYTVLSTYNGLSNLVSTRIYPDELAQGSALPALVYARVSTPPRAQAFGAGQPIIASRPRFQFTCWAAASGGTLIAMAVIAQVRAALQASIYAVTFENEYSLRDPDTALRARALDVFVNHAGA